MAFEYFLKVNPKRRRQKHFPRRSWSCLVFLVCVAISLGVAFLYPLASPVSGIDFAKSLEAPNLISYQVSPQMLEERGKLLYEAGQFAEASQVLQQLLQTYQAQGNILKQAATLNNLSLIYQQLGQWDRANAAIADSLALIQNSKFKIQNSKLLLAQALDVQGRLQFTTGKLEMAWATWQQADAVYQQAGDDAGAMRSRINQAQVLQAMGLHRRALTMLTEVSNTLQKQPDSLLKIVGWRSFGDALQMAGNLDQSEQILQQSLQLAQRSRLPEEISAALLSLGNVAQSKQKSQAALSFYQQAATISHLPATQVQAQLNQLSLLIDTQQWTAAQDLILPIQRQLAAVPLGRTGVYMQVNFAQSVMKMGSGEWGVGRGTSSALDSQISISQIAQLLSSAIQHARDLGDRRAESYALGTLGAVYEQTGQGAIAQDLTQKAFLLAQLNNAPEITYRWQWQLGRLLNRQGNQVGAIAAYTEAVKALQSLRNELVATNPEIQFSFRERVEPVYREFVALLLHRSQSGNEISPENLKRARDTIESLQLAELENFFREACLTAEVQIDQVVDQAKASTAVLYPIILANRLEVILKLPGQSLRHYTVSVSQHQVETTLDELRQKLPKPHTLREVQALSQQIYNWLIRPVEPFLEKSNPQTLVFVLDGALRNIPMAVLYDGRQYLVQKYSIALAPGLQLVSPQPLKQAQLQVLVAGLSEPRHGFPKLSYVEEEIKQIQSQVPSQILLNPTFTKPSLQQKLGSLPFPVVHLATHGQFSSDPSQTFILAWDQRVPVNEFNRLLRTKEQAGTGAIELLVLSACETAAGDKRAALGLAGVAIRAGARSTIASLWSLDDESSAVLTSQLYRELRQPETTKATALRNAQLTLMQQTRYQHPRYWAPYVLVGNWL